MTTFRELIDQAVEAADEALDKLSRYGATYPLKVLDVLANTAGTPTS